MDGSQRQKMAVLPTLRGMSTFPEPPALAAALVATPDIQPSAQAAAPLPELMSFLEGMAEPHILFDQQYRILAANAAYRRQFSRTKRTGPHLLRGFAPL